MPTQSRGPTPPESPRHDRAARLRRLRSWAGPVVLVAVTALALYFGLKDPPGSSIAARYQVGYQCWGNVYNCLDFRTQSEAQSVFEACGGPKNDVHHLDVDGNGRACDYLP